MDLSSYAKKADLTEATGVNTSNLEINSDLVSLKGEVDEIDIGKLKIVPADLSKLSNAVSNHKLFTKVSAIDNRVSTYYWISLQKSIQVKKQNLEKTIEDVNVKTLNTNNELVKNTDLLKVNNHYNTKLTEIENKIASVTGSVTTAALNAKATEIENKVCEITNLATKVDLSTKTIEIEKNP